MHPLSLTASPPSFWQIAGGWAAIAFLALATTALWGRAAEPALDWPMATGLAHATMAVAGLITAALLLDHFGRSRELDVLVLACGCLAGALLAAILVATPADPGRTPFWHFAFPLAVIAYAPLDRPVRGDPRRAALLGVGLTLVLVAPAWVAVEWGDASPVPASSADIEHAAMLVVCAVGLGALWLKRPRSVLSLALAVGLLGAGLDVLNCWRAGADDTLGWQLGQASGLASSLLLLALVATGHAMGRAGRSEPCAALARDLRECLQAMRLFHAVLESRIDPAQRRVVDRLGHAMTMGECLLDATRDAAGGRRAVDLAAEMRVVAARLTPLAADKGLALRVVTPPETIVTDPLALRALLSNLVVAAIRDTTRGGVLIGTRRRSGDLVVEVWDTGRERAVPIVASRLGALLGCGTLTASRPWAGNVVRVRLPRG
ncbi:MAG: HAMP domain-containing histidine kinase [Alphaproteobacteria bacterium]|nr:HAMP domain-containing histidine kinase [Alphaproteobacteria bacterium]